MRNLSISSISTGITLALCLLVSVPADAQPQRRGSSRTEQKATDSNRNNNGRRPGTSSNRNNNSSVSNNKGNNKNDNKKQPAVNNQNRPGNNQSQANRPNTGNNMRPGNDNKKPDNGGNKLRPGNGRPNNGNHMGQRPHATPRPGQGHVGAQRPKWNGYMAPPARPHRPHYRPMPRVTPPPYWRPHRNVPIISGILGLTFGTLYNATLDYLYSQSYNVDGYTDDIVYLRDVPQYNYNWQDVMLSYSAGRLASAQFVYSNAFYDTGRYNGVYQTLCGTYGSPISMRTLTGGGYECAWYGGNNQGMITLEYYRDGGRYYTTLSIGSAY